MTQGTRCAQLKMMKDENPTSRPRPQKNNCSKSAFKLFTRIQLFQSSTNIQRYSLVLYSPSLILFSLMTPSPSHSLAFMPFYSCHKMSGLTRRFSQIHIRTALIFSLLLNIVFSWSSLNLKHQVLCVSLRIKVRFLTAEHEWDVFSIDFFPRDLWDSN